MMRRFIASFLVIALCLTMTPAHAGFLDDFGSWASQVWEDTSGWVDQAAQDVAGAAEDALNWTTNAAEDAWEWTTNAAEDAWNWTKNAGEDAWEWTSNVATDAWNWVTQTAEDDIEESIKSDSSVNNEELTLIYSGYAYDQYVGIRTFMNGDPNIDELYKQFNIILDDLSIIDEEKEAAWNAVQDWSNEKNIPLEKTILVALPFLTRLQVEGELPLGKETVFSGRVVTQYLITALNDIMSKNNGDIDACLLEMHSMLDKLIQLARTVNSINADQNVLVTDDHYYIENFTYAGGKYQIVLVASQKNEQSQYPQINGNTLTKITEDYFSNAQIGEIEELNIEGIQLALSCLFSESEPSVVGKTIAIWGEKNNYLFFILTNQEWNDEEVSRWLSSVLMSDSQNISFEADADSDGAFFGVNHVAQKYTINRIFDESKFRVPMTGHGWAAERGNNLIDNIKGIFKGYHSIITGDNNVLNGPDRKIIFNDGSSLLIQSKYYKSASQGIAACFDEKGYRYFDAEGSPMSIEVPADQYETAIGYMQNRIANGEIEGVSDINEAYNLVKKGSLSYKQALHLAKAGTVESILYDSYHACITASTAMGLSAAVSFAVNVWNGESVEKAINNSVYEGLRTGGKAFIISVLSKQIARTGLSKVMIPASKVIVQKLGPKAAAAIVNAFRPVGSAIYGAAAMSSAAKLLRGNVISSAVSFVVLSAGDVIDIIDNRISLKQLIKNLAKTAAGVGGAAAGFTGGAALGSLIFPGAGTIVGGAFGLAGAALLGWGAEEGAKALADLIAEDDAIEMGRIIKEQLAELAQEYLLNEKELEQVISNIQDQLSADLLKDMYQSDDHEEFARQLIETAIDPVVKSRQYIVLPAEDEYADYVAEVLEKIYEEIGDEPAEEGI